MNLKQKATKGLLWSAFEQFSKQGLQFVLGIIIARILSPSDYGLIGMLGVFIAISQTFIDSGFKNALIQKKDRDQLDYSTVFFFNLGLSLLIYLILFFSSPYISAFYNEPQLTLITRVIGLTLIINALKIVPLTRLSITLDFKTQSKASIPTLIISGLIGLSLAYKGYGVWTLIYQNIISSILNLVLLTYFTKWHPNLSFSYTRFKSLFNFGYKMLLTALMDNLFRNIYTLIIGKSFSANTLGYYTRANQLGQFASSNITGIIQRVSFPLLSELQDNEQQLRQVYRKLIVQSALLIFPLMLGLASLATPLIVTVLTDKWLPAAWMLQFLCFSQMWYPIHAINLNIINVKGRSDLFLKLEIIKKIIIITILFITVPLGIKAMLIGSVCTSLIALVINTYYPKQMIDYGFFQQLKDLSPILLLSLTMSTLVYLLNKTITLEWVQLLVGIFTGGIFYFSLGYLFNIADCRALIQPVIRKIIK